MRCALTNLVSSVSIIQNQAEVIKEQAESSLELQILLAIVHSQMTKLEF